ncbi:hypothetical protein FA13DRAFT_1088713 [Coprinellus micaceus]|uniref:Uncharacterized protein n=1 Tax=Coprinellus micaceus TaxID=71717 RepID=A0A4Y7TRR2_COPMI|nr:hypothetical protein FA13DRAFT_1088713 [Coprinellus micaceus]
MSQLLVNAAPTSYPRTRTTRCRCTLCFPRFLGFSRRAHTSRDGSRGTDGYKPESRRVHSIAQFYAICEISAIPRRNWPQRSKM